MRVSTRLSFVVVLAALIPACFSVTDFDDIDTSQEETFTLPYVQNLDGFDILFVVDSSGSVAPLMAGIGYRAPDMLESLDVALDGAQSLGFTLHIGLITPDLGAGAYPITNCTADGDAGILQTRTSFDCSPLEGTHIVVVDDIVQNMGYVNDLPTAVQCLIDGLGERLAEEGSGCGFEQPLAAVAKALDPVQTPENQSFFRPNAGLAVVLMTDEDDCSAADDSVFDPGATATLGPLSSFRCFEWGVVCDEDPRMPGAKTNCRPRTAGEGGLLHEPAELADMIFEHKSRSSVVFATVAEPADFVNVSINQYSEPQLDPVCVDTGMPGIRLRSFMEQFGDDGLTDSMCAPELDQLLYQISERMASQAVSRCMPRTPADMDPDTGGVQVDCTAWDVTNLGQVDEWRSADILSCELTGEYPPCWKVKQDTVCTSGYKMEVLREQMPMADSIVEATCEVLID
ncbi:MAG: hypothetical protein ABI333_30915 [bacterium]